MSIITKAILQCPLCSSKYIEKMAFKNKQLSSRCVFCNTVFEIINKSECCVYCSYSNVLCPEKQSENLNK